MTSRTGGAWRTQPAASSCEVVAPLAIGQHRDHVLTRKASARLDAPVWHYVDFPYVVAAECRVEDLVPDGAERFSLDISPGGLAAWQDGFVCHRSQIQLLFSDEEEARAAIRRYSETGGGRTLFRF